jgi:hypothetical protein
MATFIWDPAVQWPPPAHILLNHDVVAPDGVLLSSLRDRRGRGIEEESMQPYFALISPLSGGYPDQGLPPVSPGSPSHPWVPPGSGGVPSHPIVIPGTPPGQPGSPTHPIYVPIYPDLGLPPGSPGSPTHPWVPPGAAGWPSHPISGGGAPSHPIHIPGIPDQGLPPGEPVPPDQIVMPEPPVEYQDDLIVSVYRPGQGWTTTSYTVAPDQGQPAPTPHRR